MTSEVPRTRKSRGLVPEPFGEGSEPGKSYARLREWRGDDLISLLFRTSIRLQTTFDRRFAQFGITAQEAADLGLRAEGGGNFASKIPPALGREKGATERVVYPMEGVALFA